VDLDGGCVVSALEERRERAREAYWDRRFDLEDHEMGRDLEEAIETATRVQITTEMVIAGWGGQHYLTPKERVRAILQAAGFEVEE